MTQSTHKITHHPSEALLLDHYHNRLAEGPDLLVATHVDMCTHCRETLRLFPAIGGVLLEEIETVELSEDALELALARIERPFDALVAETPALKPDTAKSGAFLDRYGLAESLTRRVPSRYWAAPGVWIAPVRPERTAGTLARRPAKTYLLGVAPGMVMPPHDHGGAEMTLVMHGGFSDAEGTYDVGDFIEKAPGDVHSPAIDETEGCISLITQTEPIKPRTILGILLKPFARI